MKKHSLIFGIISVVAFLAPVPNSQAYYLDTPHNESNGILCLDCHSGSEWDDPEAYGDGMDLTVANTICLRCHDASSVGPKKGPEKVLHASSTTSTDLGTWSTQCVDCHDSHFQPQLSWVAEDIDAILASGTLVEASIVPSGGDTGTTTFSVNSVIGTPPYNAPTLWDTKGGFMDKARAQDGSRGLLLLSNNIPATGDTFEIVAVTDQGGGNYDVTVKGDLTSAPTNGAFMVFYGQSIKKKIKDRVTGYNRNVKFFTPEIIADADGGYIDLDPVTKDIAPSGLCQVCHTQTSFWDGGGAEQSHNVGTRCGECHKIETGGSGGADHSAFIADDQSTDASSNCSDCHVVLVASPGSGHPSCDNCHTATRPELNSNTFNAAGNPADTGTVSGAMTDILQYSFDTEVYSYVDNPTDSYDAMPRVQDSGGLFIDEVGFTPILCGECHNAKPQGLTDSIHGGHADNHFGWDGNCSGCHGAGAGTEPVVQIIHGDVCVTCHDNAGGGTGTAIIGAAANGIDGNATLGVSAAPHDGVVCSTCHGGYTPAVIHHDTLNDLAVGGNCTNCHTGSHLDNHSTMVASYTNCSACHTLTGTTVDPGDPKVHDACIDCHEVNLTSWLVQLRIGSSAEGNDGGDDGGTNGGGNCFVCHGEYFVSHTNANHSALVDGAAVTVDCTSCHTATAGTGSGVPIAPGDTKVHDACSTCHNTDGALKTYAQADTRTPDIILATIPDGGAGSDNGGGTCDDCHGAYFGSHTVTHAVSVADTANCNTCHPNTKGLVTGITVTAADNKIHDTCFTCHDSSAGLLMGLAAANNAGTDATVIAMTTTGDCNACHGVYFFNHKNVNHVTPVADTANCNSCHTATAGSASVKLLNTTTGDNKVHDGCSDCHTSATGSLLAPYGSASAISTGDCNNCHAGSVGTDGYFEEHANMSHIGRVDGLAACITCHTATAGTSGGYMPVNSATPSGDKVHDACTDCHNTTNGDLLGAYGYATAVTAGNCGTCHTGSVGTDGYFEEHIHHYGAQDQLAFSYTVDRSQELNDPSTACNECHTDDTDSSGTPLDSFTDILGEHVAGCGRCHSYTEDVDLTPTEAEVAAAIATVYPTPVNCTTCHVKKLWSSGASSTHGGHADNHFGWGSDGCSSCHGGGSGTEAVVKTIHANDCDICHTTGGPYNVGTEKVGVNGDGDATLANGAAGAGTPFDPTVYICLTCHDVTDPDVTPASLGGIHHENTGSVTYTATNCALCHTGVAHTSMVKDTPGNCDGCHTGTADTNGAGVPLNSSDAKVHDTCGTCHEFAATPAFNGDLIAVPGPRGLVSTMSDGGTIGGTDGGGNCTDCHGTYFSSHNVTHLARVATTTNCSTCHTTTAGTASGIPTAAGDNKIHDDCFTCHDSSTGLLMGLAAANNAGTDATVIAMTTTGDCNACHGVYFFNHKNVSHVTPVADTANCNSCHTATAGSASVKLLNTTTGDNKVHDGCSDCHTSATGSLLAPYGSASAISTGDCNNCHAGSVGTDGYFEEHTNMSHIGRVDGLAACITCHTATAGTSGGYMPVNSATPSGDKVHDACTDCHNTTNGDLLGAYGYATAVTAGNCGTCHAGSVGTDGYFEEHTHHYGAQDQLAFSYTVDRSQDNDIAANACNVCHTDDTDTSGTALDSFTDILGEHVTGCGRCHSYTEDVDLTPTEAEVAAAIATVYPTPVNCITCHVKKDHASGASSIHGGHSPTNFGWAGNCSDCHGGGSGTEAVVQTIHANDCDLCHTTDGPYTADTNKVGANGNGSALLAEGDAGTWISTCLICHPDATYPAPAIHHDRAEATAGNCVFCHLPEVDSTGPIANRGAISMPPNLACNYCHLYFAGWANDLTGGYETTAGGEVKIFDLRFNPNGATNGRLPTATEVPSHSISTNITTPINDYAACFACHGFTGAGTVADNTNDTGADKIGPFHGLGTAYSGDGNASGGDAGDVINAYSGPQVAMVYGEDSGGLNPVKSVPFHPGWNAFNWLACDIGYGCGATKPYAYDEAPGWHLDDLGDRDPATSAPCNAGAFDIPWDDYTLVNPLAPGSITRDFGTIGGGSKARATTVPTIALDASGCGLPTNATKIIRAGTGKEGNKNGGLTALNKAYIDLNAPYPASAKNNGTVTGIDFHTIVIDGGNMTIFTCENVTATSCTVTAATSIAVSDDMNTVSLLIKPGGVVGVYIEGTTTVDLSNAASAHPANTGTIKVTETLGGEAPLLVPAAGVSLSYGNDTDYSNFGARIETLPY